MLKLVGRIQEQERLRKLFESPESEFLAIYGRRRVGKTFMVRESFEQSDCIYFEVVGQKSRPLSVQ